MPVVRHAAVAGLLLALGAAGGCADRLLPEVEPLTGGDPRNGQTLISHFGCGSCHRIPGVRNANSLIGPPLERFRERAYIAGVIPNDAANLIRWIQDPRGTDPRTAMPSVGASADQARDIAAFLYSR
ncbi:MAG TPA: c-type cytochrome [Burkholderiaceae bacterium]|jgi:cytochrome c|nr:c-type cytochrome [Burkholderiaceae bacterium]